MSCEFQPEHPQQFYSPGWHGEARTPVVDGKYYDMKTGKVLTAADHEEYSGPPAVDIIIASIHEDTTQCVFRAALPFRMEALLSHIVRVTGDRKLELDSLTATAYAIRVILAHELTTDEFSEISMEMALGIWNQK